jgi:olfactory receptor
MSLFLLFGSVDDMLLTVMAYDRYVAICHPLHYTVIMNPRLCVFSVSAFLVISLLDLLLEILIVLQSSCFKDVEVSNFSCYPSQVLHLSCFHTLIKNIITYFIGFMFGIFPITMIFFSYYKIVSSILKIPSSSGRYKAFSTCGSHLSVICLFYGTGTGVYLGSSVSHSASKGMVTTFLYTVVTPMLNPFIYSLGNKDVSSALKRLHSSVFHLKVGSIM